MNPFKLLSPSYLFDPVPGDTFLYGWTLMIFFILLFAASWKVKDLIKHTKNPKVSLALLGGIPSRMREFGFIGAVLVFIRAENIPYVGMRIWLVLWILAMLSYGIWIWRNYKKNFSVKIVEKKEKATTDKYLPQAKKKKRKKRR